MSNTAVNEKDLPAIPEPTYVNAPATVEEAVQRLLQVEMLLEDLSRAVEIAQITGQINLVEGFRNSADEYLKTKIQIEQPDMGDFKVTIVTNDKEDAKA
jgi:C4-type Zn-finger protein